MSELPNGWSKVCIADVVDKPKQNKPEADEKIIYVDIGSINRERKVIENPQQLTGADAPSRARKRINTDDVLVSLTRPNLNTVAIVPEYLDQQYASTGFDVLKPNSIHPKFLFYLVRTRKFIDAISGKVQGALYPAAKSSDVQSFEFHAPNLDEQKRIADKLDSVLAKVEAAQARLDKIPAILKRFRQSVLAAATSGELTKEWRENAGISEMNWGSDLLKNLTHSISDGDHQAPPRVNDGIPFLVISNVSKGKIEFSKVTRWVPHEYFEKLKSVRKPERGDILYTVTGSYGISIVVDTDKPFCFQRHIAILKPDLKKVSSSYLSLWLESPLVFKHAGEVATGTAQKTVSLSNLRKYQVSVPSLEEQAKIVESTTNLFMKMDSVKKQYFEAKERLNKLTQSVLAKAFKGELLLNSVDSDIESIENSIEALNA